MIIYNPRFILLLHHLSNYFSTNHNISFLIHNFLTRNSLWSYINPAKGLFYFSATSFLNMWSRSRCWHTSATTITDRQNAYPHPAHKLNSSLPCLNNIRSPRNPSPSGTSRPIHAQPNHRRRRHKLQRLPPLPHLQLQQQRRRHRNKNARSRALMLRRHHRLAHTRSQFPHLLPRRALLQTQRLQRGKT